MVDLTGSIWLIVFFTAWNVQSNTSCTRNLTFIRAEEEKCSSPVIINKLLNLSPEDAAPSPRSLLSPVVIHSEGALPTPLQIKEMSTKTKPLSVSSRRKRRLAPLIPPLIPPIIPPLPFLPLPIIPLLPPPLLPLTLIPKVVNPIKSLQKLKRKTDLEKRLKSVGKDKPVKLPGLDAKKNILEKLIDLKKKGSLTTAEFIRFKKLLLH